MLIYKDIITSDEITSDTYKIVPVDSQPLLWKIIGKTRTKGSDNIDDSLLGGNASAEAEPESFEADQQSTQVIDIIDGFRLQNVPALPKTSFKDFRTAMKSFVKGVVEKLEKPEDVEEFKNGAAGALKYLYSNLQDYEFYVGESMNPNGLTCFLNYEEDGVTPFLVVFKHGLVAEKC